MTLAYGLPQRKKFGGKTYHQNTLTFTKKDAEKSSERMKEMGYLVRIVPVPKKHSDNWKYCTYIWRKDI